MKSRLGPIARLSPTSFESWARCRRLFLLRHVLGLPESDSRTSSDLGLLTHSLLERIHQQGTCHDDANVRDVLEGHAPGNDTVRVMVERHRARCPQEVDSGHHEVDRARYHHAPHFLVTARLDAVWVHDGIIDVRDYKSGGRNVAELRDHLPARVQAWVLGRRIKPGHRIRLRYEYLSPEVDDDPDPWEPDDDDIAAIGEQLATIVRAMQAGDFSGTDDDQTCQYCAYRSICSESRAAGLPTWPVSTLTDAGTVDG